VSRQLWRLCERGLAERVASEHDGRATDAILTKAGRAAIEVAAPGHVAFVRRMLVVPLPDQLLAPLTAALEHVYVNINFNSSLPPAPGEHVRTVAGRRSHFALPSHGPAFDSRFAFA
jgi:hypothetical protein